MLVKRCVGHDMCTGPD